MTNIRMNVKLLRNELINNTHKFNMKGNETKILLITITNADIINIFSASHQELL